MRFVPLLVLASLLLCSEARAQDAPAPLPPGSSIAMPLSWQDLEKASYDRWRWGRFLTIVGALGAGMGVAALAYEAAVVRDPSSDANCALGCEYNLVMGTFNGIASLGLLGAGIGMLIRGFNLGQLADVLRIEGPSPVWTDWLDAGLRMRTAGNFLAPMGSLVLALGAALLLPAERTCIDRHCSNIEYNDLDTAAINARRNAGLVLAITGSAMVITGASLIIAGYMKQHRVMQFRGQYVQPQIMLSVSPGGLTLTW